MRTFVLVKSRGGQAFTERFWPVDSSLLLLRRRCDQPFRTFTSEFTRFPIQSSFSFYRVAVPAVCGRTVCPRSAKKICELGLFPLCFLRVNHWSPRSLAGFESPRFRRNKTGQFSSDFLLKSVSEFIQGRSIVEESERRSVRNRRGIPAERNSTGSTVLGIFRFRDAWHVDSRRLWR